VAPYKLGTSSHFKKIRSTIFNLNSFSSFYFEHTLQKWLTAELTAQGIFPLAFWRSHTDKAKHYNRDLLFRAAFCGDRRFWIDMLAEAFQVNAENPGVRMLQVTTCHHFLLSVGFFSVLLLWSCMSVWREIARSLARNLWCRKFRELAFPESA